MSSVPTLDRAAPASLPLRRNDFNPIALNGWGDGYNAYAHAMAWFQGGLYVGAARGNLHLIKRRNPPPLWRVYPVSCPDDPFTLDLRARIVRWEPASATWRTVHCSPMVRGSDGRVVPREIGFRGMAVFQGPSDPAPALYVSSFSPTRAPGPMVFRSDDGGAFTPVSEPGFGLPGISAFRSLVAFKGRLYTSPVGATQNRPNQSTYPIVFESADPARGRWRPVSAPGFGNPANMAAFELAAFDGRLYAGTGNAATGFEVWRTDAEGEPPYRWTQVVRLGAYRGNLNQGVLSMCVFKDALYVGTAIQDGGYDRANRIGPAAGEVIRIHPDDSWELVVGASRLTPQGARFALSGLIPGFNNFFNGYIWRMCVHDDHLYVGTWDWSTFLLFCAVEKWPAPLRELVETIGIEETIRSEGGFDLVRTRDGKEWFPVTKTGFDNKFNCGVRTMVSTPLGLAVGTVNPFGPDVAERRGDAWEYVANPRGGLEIWLGRRGSGPEGEESPPEEPLNVRLLSDDPDDADRPARKRVYKRDSASLELTHEQLREMGRRANPLAVRADYVASVTRYHHLSVAGGENLPRRGAVVIACNHVGAPIAANTSVMLEDVILMAHALAGPLGRPARNLGDPGFYDTEIIERLCRKTNEQLGMVPATLGNGTRLLEMGEALLVFPEGRVGRPGYRTRPFYWGFAQMAWKARAPIVPAAIIGPQESRPRLERAGLGIYLNSYKPLPADYTITFLPPLDVRRHVASLGDKEALRAFCETVRRQVQAVLDREAAGRTHVTQVLALQKTFGDPERGPLPRG